MCPDHYAEVPESLKAAIKSAKRDPDSQEYIAAVRNALAHVLHETQTREELEDFVDWWKG